MDPDEPNVEAADPEAGGDNMLNPSMTSYPTASSKFTQDDINFVDDEKDTFEKVNINNSNTTSDVTETGEIPSEDRVETDPMDIGDRSTERLAETVEDLGPLSRENQEMEEDEAAPEGLSFSDDFGGDEDAEMGGAEDAMVGEEEYSKLVADEDAEVGGAKDAEELGEIYQEDVIGESLSEKYEDEQMFDEEENASDGARRDEDEEQHQASDEDDTKESSAQEEPTDESPQNLKKLQRVALYKEGLKLLEDPGNIDNALQSFLAAITGLTEKEAFTDLPQCLHQISNIYFEKNEYEKAVQFIQAEKMYYETALIDIVNLQKELEVKRQEKGEDGAEGLERLPTEGPDSPEIIKAKEYEDLAKLCLKESKPQLALEYCGKATKAYREVYGDDHPITVGSLDLFTMIYADVGKKLYADAMEKFGVEEKDLEKSAARSSETESSSQVPAAGEETTNELRQRRQLETSQPTSQPSAGPASPTDPATGEEFEPAPQPQEQDDWVTTCLLMLLFLLITVLVILVMSYFYCQGNERSTVCHELKGDLSYWYMKIKHYYLGYGRR